MELSIIVTSFQRAHLLKWGLLSLSRQIIPFEYEILVINDGLEDNTKQVCDSYSQLPIRYIFTGQRNKQSIQWRVAGFPINIGIKQAKGKNIILTCAEIFVLDDCIKNINSYLNKDFTSVIITEGKDDTTGKYLKEVINTQGHPSMDSYFTSYLQSLCTDYAFFMGLNRQRVIDIGGYDEDFTGYAYDDTDFSRRLKENKSDFIKIPGKIVHLYHERNTNRPGIKDILTPLRYNEKLYNERKGIVIRNIDREWGQIGV